jgi:hypothetical protein
MAADTIGVFKRIFLENNELRSTSLGSTSEYEGTRRTSSNVRPSYNSLSFEKDIWQDLIIFAGANYENFRTPETFTGRAL